MTRPVAVSGLLFLGAVGGATAESLSGDVLVGWRDVAVEGNENKYFQHVNLDDGARLLGLSLDYRAENQGTGLPDSASLDVSGLGGDPFQNIRLRVRDIGNYDFRYEHRRSEYFYDDLIIDPSEASIEGSTGGDFHRFDTVRETDSASIGITLSSRASLSLGFDRYERRGDTTTTLDIQRDEFELDRPVDEILESVSVGFGYRFDRMTLLVEQSLRDFESDNPVFLPGFSEGGNVDDPATLDFYFLDQPYSYDSSETRVRLSGRPTDRLELRFGASIIDLDMAMLGQERAQGVNFTGVPFTVDQSGSGNIDREIGLYDLSLGYALTDRMSVTGRLNRRQLDQQGAFDFGPDGGSGDWSIDTGGARLGVDFAWRSGINLSAGWSTEARDVEVLEETPNATLPLDTDTNRNGMFFIVDVRPGSRMDIEAQVQLNQIDDPFTLASPTDSTRYRLRGRFRFADALTIIATHRLEDLANDNSGWSAETRQTDLRLAYRTERIGLSAGASRIDLSRDIDQLVTGGSRQDLFIIGYRGDTWTLDTRVDVVVNDFLNLAGSFRRYDNDGSFDVTRDDFSLAGFLTLPRNYRLGLSYRRIDYEDDVEAYDADIVELSLGMHW